MFDLRGTDAPGPGIPLTYLVAGFAVLCLMLFGIISSFHLHGWKGFGLAFLLSALIFAVGRLAGRRITQSTERERRDPRARRAGNRAERREGARRRK